MSLAGKIAAVTASTKGIGLACAERFLNEGAVVYISSRKDMAVKRQVERLNFDHPDRVFGTACHVSDKVQRSNLKNMILENHGKLDILVSNAANNNYYGPTVACPEKSWEKILNVNVVSSAMLVQEFLPLLQAAGDKSNIVCISSIAASRKTDNLGPYAVSKAALSSMVRQMSRELAQKNIRINAVEPGIVETDFAKVLVEDPETVQDFDQKRYGQPHEIASFVKFLASDEASFITGESLPICGGKACW